MNEFQKVIRHSLNSGLSLIVAVALASSTAYAQNYASADRVQAARGHYARARALLVEALAEFERGRTLARPDILLDSQEWRLNVVSRTEELNRLLDPKPRVTRSGVRYKANPLLVRQENERKRAVDTGVRASNDYGERASRNNASSRTIHFMDNDSSHSSEQLAKSPVLEENETKEIRALIRKRIDTQTEETNAAELSDFSDPNDGIPTPLGEKSLDGSEEEATIAAALAAEQEPEADEDAEVQAIEPVPAFAEDEPAEEDEEISQAIEAAIRARLKRANGTETQ